MNPLLDILNIYIRYYNMPLVVVNMDTFIHSACFRILDVDCNEEREFQIYNIDSEYDRKDLLHDLDNAYGKYKTSLGKAVWSK